MDGYWRYCVRDEKDREFVVDKIEKVRNGDEVWGETEYKEWIKKRGEDREVVATKADDKADDGEGQEANEATGEEEKVGEKRKFCSIL